jgi:hypothetical protein
MKVLTDGSISFPNILLKKKEGKSADQRKTMLATFKKNNSEDQ